MTSILFPEQPNAATTVLEFSGLAIGYEGQAPVAEGLAAILKGGEALALVGGNGSGKTTLLKTIAGLLEAHQGKLQILGKSPKESYGNIAWLGQFHPTNPVLPLRVHDIIRMAHYPNRGLWAPLTRADEAVGEAALEFVGMSALRKKTLGTLSGGQRQKVFLAYTLARRAALVLLDEPTQNLDGQGDELVALARKNWIASGTTVVTATHDRTEAGMSTFVLNFSGTKPQSGS